MISRVTFHNFPPGGPVNGPRPGTRADLILHALVAGRWWYATVPAGGWGLPAPPPAPVTAFSLDELTFLAGRVLTISSYLRTDPAGMVESTPFYHSLEATEKGQASEAMGVALTSLLAYTEFAVPVLFHVRQLPPGLVFGLAPGAGGSRPDFLGYDGAQWLVLEAKGRNQNTSAAARASAKQQAQKVATVQGVPPARQLGVVCLMRTAIGQIRGEIVDPPAKKDALKLDNLDRPRLDERRYGPLIRALASDLDPLTAQTGDGTTFRFFELPGVGYLGVEEPLAVVLERHVGSTEYADEISDDLDAVRQELASRRHGRVPAVPDPDPAANAESPHDFVDLAGRPHEVVVTGDGIALAIAPERQPE